MSTVMKLGPGFLLSFATASEDRMEEGYGGQQGASEEEFSFDKRQQLALSLLNYWLGDYLLP